MRSTHAPIPRALRTLCLGSTLALVSLLGPTATADNLLTITGSGDTGQSFDSGEAVATSFVLTLPATNVTVSAPISGFGATGSLWLTNKIETGTTIGNVIAAEPYTSGVGVTPTFSGLSLAPGTYFFVLAIDTGFAVWPASTVPTITGNGSATPGLDFRTNATDSFPPASNFDAILGDGHLHLTVTGTEVPEPATPTWVLLVAGGGMLVVCRRRWRAQKRATL